MRKTGAPGGPSQHIVGNYWLLTHLPFGHDWVRAERDAPWRRYTNLQINADTRVAESIEGEAPDLASPDDRYDAYRIFPELGVPISTSVRRHLDRERLGD